MKRLIMHWKIRIGLWWYDYVNFPLWRRFGSKKSHLEIKESLRKRRESGGCSMWRNYLKDHPEAAKYDWEKKIVKGDIK